MKFISLAIIAASMLAVSQPANARGTENNMTHDAMNRTGVGNSQFDRNWNSQNDYWRNQYRSSAYYSNSRDYSMYEPAYRYGYDLYNRNNGRPYNELSQNNLRSGWDQARGNSDLGWTDAQNATRDAYNRMYESRNSSM